MAADHWTGTGMRERSRPSAVRRTLAILLALLPAGACRSSDPAPEDGDYWRAGEAAVAAEDWERAASLWYEAALQSGDESPVPFREASRALWRSGDAESATSLLDRGLLLHPHSTDLLILRAVLLEDQGFSRAAETDYQTATECDPARGDAWLGLGRVRLELNCPRAAVEPLRQAIERGAPGVQPLCLLARALRSAGDPAGAAEAYVAALARVPETEVDLLVEAASLMAEGDLAEAHPGELARALGLLDLATSRDPQHAEAHFVRGVLLERSGDGPGAMKSYRRAVEVDNFHLEATTNLAVLYARAGDEKAMEMLERALELEPSEARRAALQDLVVRVN
jgi:tetratricopeptide (TPR) repeat protein